MLDEHELGEVFARHFQRSAFRLELRGSYEVGSDGGDYQRWLEGAVEPTWERKNAWLDVLRADTAQGRSNARVKVMSDPMTDYERYACEWGYALNVTAGEDVGVIDLSEQSLPGDVVDHDFWLLDDALVIVMHYDRHGHFEAGEIASADRLPDYVRTRNNLETAAEDFQTWWARHPERHRNFRAA